MRKYVEADIDVVFFEGTAAEIITDSYVACGPIPCRSEDHGPLLFED